MSVRRRRPLALVAALVLAAVAVACSDDDDAAPPGTTRPGGPTTSAVDLSGVSLGVVRGQTTTTGPVATGSASIVGTVRGPGGPVPGATVRIERLAGSGATRTDVLTGADGRFELRGIPGGPYRVRAFLAPALAMTEPEVRFLRDREEHPFDLVVEDQRRIVARGAVAPDPPYVGEDLNLAVAVATRSVDADGVVRSAPVVGTRVELSGLGAWSLRTGGSTFPPRGTSTTLFRSGSTVAFTDSFGEVRYELRCEVAGDPGLSVLVSVLVTPPAVEGQPPPVPEPRLERLRLDLPECVDPFAVVVPPEGTQEPEG